MNGEKRCIVVFIISYSGRNLVLKDFVEIKEREKF